MIYHVYRCYVLTVFVNEFDLHWSVISDSVIHSDTLTLMCPEISVISSLEVIQAWPSRVRVYDLINWEHLRLSHLRLGLLCHCPVIPKTPWFYVFAYFSLIKNKSFKFSPTWNCGSLPWPTTSSGWKLFITFLIWDWTFAHLDVQTLIPFPNDSDLFSQLIKQNQDWNINRWSSAVYYIFLLPTLIVISDNCMHPSCGCPFSVDALSV